MSFWEMLKNFFKDSSSGVFTEENYPGLMGIFNVAHIICICLTVVGITLLCCFFRKTEHKNIRTYLRISAIVWIALEIFKLSWIGYNQGFLEIIRQLPFQLCSIFLYALAFSGWGKGKLKLVGDNFLASFGIVGGFFGMVFTSIFNLYPIIHFNTLHSMFFHFSMMFTGIFMLTSGYVKLHYKNMIYSLAIIVADMLVAVILNESGLKSNFVYLGVAEGTPVAFLGFLPHVVYIITVMLIVASAQAILYLPSLIIEKRKARKQSQGVHSEK